MYQGNRRQVPRRVKGTWTIAHWGLLCSVCLETLGGVPYRNGMRPFLIRWLCTTIAVAVAVKLTGMRAESVGALLGTSLFLGIINALLRPIVLLLSLPFIVATLGLFILVVNAVMLSIAGGLVPGFFVGGFGNAFLGAIIVSLVSWALSLFFRGSDGRYHLITHHTDVKRVEGRVVE